METPAGPPHRRAWKESPTLCWLRSGQKEREASSGKARLSPSVGGPRVNASSRPSRGKTLCQHRHGGVRAAWRGGSEAAASSAETPASTQHVYCGPRRHAVVVLFCLLRVPGTPGSSTRLLPRFVSTAMRGPRSAYSTSPSLP